MSQNLTEKEKEFLKRTTEKRKEKVEDISYLTLAAALKDDIPLDETTYVVQRLRRAIYEAFMAVPFEDEALAKAQMAAYRKHFKKVKEAYKKPDNLKKAKKDMDETDLRDAQCEPVVKKVFDMIMNEELLFSDDEYYDDVLQDYNGGVVASAAQGYVSSLDEMLFMIVQRHWREALKQLTGVYKEDITYSMMEEILNGGKRK